MFKDLLAGGQYWLQANIGWILVVGIILIAYELMTAKRKGVLFTVGFIFILVPGIARYAPPLWATSGIGGSDSTQSIFCTRYGGIYCQTEAAQASVSAISAESGGVTYSFGTGGGTQSGQTFQAQPQPKTTVTLLPGALNTWFTEFKVKVGGNLMPDKDVQVSMADFLKGSDVQRFCENCNLMTGEKGEVWHWAVSINGETLTFDTNSKIGRNVQGMSEKLGADEMNTFTGLGEWDKICPDCVKTETIYPTGIGPTAPSTGAASTVAGDVSLMGCASEWATQSGYVSAFPPGFQNTSNTSTFCLNGGWVTADQFPNSDPVSVLAQYDALFR